MTNKQLVSDLVERLPEDISLQEIVHEIEFIAGVKEGFDQIEREEGVPVEDVERMISSWTNTE